MLIDKNLFVFLLLLWWAFTAFSGGFMGYNLGLRKGKLLRNLSSARMNPAFSHFYEKRQPKQGKTLRWNDLSSIYLNTPLADAQMPHE